MNEDKILELVMQDNPANPLGYVSNIVRPFALKQMNTYIRECNDCGICNCIKTVGFGTNLKNPSILIIGECPDQKQQELKSENPFDTVSGTYLLNKLKELEINPDDIYFINSVNCYPVKSKISRPPTVSERTCCKVFIDYLIKVIDPLMVITLGSVATNALNEDIGKQNILDIRGQSFQYRGIDVFPTINPGLIEEYKTQPEVYNNEYIEYLELCFNKDLEKAFSFFYNKYENIEK